MSMTILALDPYFLDVLMPDLVGHERSASSFVVYLYLWRKTTGRPGQSVQVSYATIALETGLSRVTAQRAAALLKRRRLISIKTESRTGVPGYTVLRPWIGRLQK